MLYAYHKFGTSTLSDSKQEETEEKQEDTLLVSGVSVTRSLSVAAIKVYMNSLSRRGSILIAHEA